MSAGLVTLFGAVGAVAAILAVLVPVILTQGKSLRREIDGQGADLRHRIDAQGAELHREIDAMRATWAPCAALSTACVPSWPKCAATCTS